MAAKSTRQKILKHREAIYDNNASALYHLKAMWELSEDRSQIMDEITPAIIRTYEVLGELLEKMFRGL